MATEDFSQLLEDLKILGLNHEFSTFITHDENIIHAFESCSKTGVLINLPLMDILQSSKTCPDCVSVHTLKTEAGLDMDEVGSILSRMTHILDLAKNVNLSDEVEFESFEEFKTYFALVEAVKKLLNMSEISPYQEYLKPWFKKENLYSLVRVDLTDLTDNVFSSLFRQESIDYLLEQTLSSSFPSNLFDEELSSLKARALKVLKGSTETIVYSLRSERVYFESAQKLSESAESELMELASQKLPGGLFTYELLGSLVFTGLQGEAHSLSTLPAPLEGLLRAANFLDDKPSPFTSQQLPPYIESKWFKLAEPPAPEMLITLDLIMCKLLEQGYKHTSAFSEAHKSVLALNS